MSADIFLRVGRPDDAPDIATLMLAAGGGLFEHLLTGVVGTLTPAMLLNVAVANPDGPFRYDNAVLADRKGTVCGLMLGFPAAAYHLLDALTVFIPAGRLAPVRDLLEAQVPTSFYVNSLAVTAKAGGRGVGRLLMAAAAELAVAQGFARVTLHVWEGNAQALAFYHMLGFTTQDAQPISPRSAFVHTGPVRLMMAATDELARRCAAGQADTRDYRSR